MVRVRNVVVVDRGRRWFIVLCDFVYVVWVVK